MNQYLSYQKFATNDDALSFIYLLKKHNIRFKIEDTTQIFDPTWANNNHELKVNVMVFADDFSKLDIILENQSELSIDDFDKEHYLFNFNNDELINILKKSDEWSIQDRILARKILEQKQIMFSNEEITTWKKERYKLLEAEKRKNRTVSSAMFEALDDARGSFDTWQQKEILRDGTKVPLVNKEERRNGLLKFIVAALIVIGILIFKVYKRM
jgi:hypothetical protein